MRCLVLNPPYVVERTRVIWPEAAMLPIGPLAIATALQERSHEVDFRDYAFARRVPAAIDASEFDLVLIACHTFRNVSTTRRLLDRIHGAKHIVLGGNLCTELGITDFAKVGIKVDTVVRGYGHGLIDKLESRVKGDLRPAEISARMAVPNLSLLDNETRRQYHRISGGRYPIIGPGGFGCAWSCNYCAAKMDTRRVERNLAEIEQEVTSARKSGYAEIWCVDNIVLADAGAAMEFDQIVSRVGATWLGMTRAETVRTAKKSLGRFRTLTDIAIGVEASPRALRSLNRGVRSDNELLIKESFQQLRDAGIGSTAFVMLDLPSSTDQDYWDLLDFLCDVEPGNVSWSFYNPPALEMIRLGIDPSLTGFYRWPLGCGNLPCHRVVQHAMVITGTWWSGWSADAFIEDDDRFGVEFDEGVIAQPWTARSPVGDLWDVWSHVSLNPPVTLEARKAMLDNHRNIGGK